MNINIQFNIKQFLAIFIPIFIIGVLCTPYQTMVVNISHHIVGKVTAILIILFYAEMNITYGFLSLVFVVFFYKIFDTEFINSGTISGSFTEINDNNIVKDTQTSLFGNEPTTIFITKRTKTSLYQSTNIPLVIYQTWHTKSLPPKMAECVDKLKRENPEFEHHLYDDADCREFIHSNFDISILETYDRLIPGAYKADLWRYCILYKNGGIYLDIKFQCENGFKLTEFAKQDETYVLDQPFSMPTVTVNEEISIINQTNYYDVVKRNIYTWKNKQMGIYNAVMATKPNNPVILRCIKRIVDNVKNRYYGFSPLYPTGPGLLGEQYFGSKFVQKVNDFNYFNSMNGKYIISRKKKILSQYPEYRYEQSKYRQAKNGEYYSTLWTKKNIYVNGEIRIT